MLEWLRCFTHSCSPCHSRILVDPLLVVHYTNDIRISSLQLLLGCEHSSARRLVCLYNEAVSTRLLSNIPLSCAPLGCSKSRNSSLQLFSRGLSKSHSSPSITEMTVLSNNDFEIFRAMSPGVDSHAVPISKRPSDRAISILSWGFSVHSQSESVCL